MFPRAYFQQHWRILAYLIYLPELTEYLDGDELSTTQSLCNFLDVDQHTFYDALRKVYSVVDVPDPEDAIKAPSSLAFLLHVVSSGTTLIQKPFIPTIGEYTKVKA